MGRGGKRGEDGVARGEQNEKMKFNGPQDSNFSVTFRFPDFYRL